jgi:DNA gyrase subunit A
MGKRTLVSEFGIQKRGGKGVKCYKITEKTGNVVGVKAVNEDNEVMMITTEGVIIQIAVGGISVYGRNTSGVKLINLDDGVTVAKIAKVREKIVDSPAEGEDVEELDVSDETENFEDVEADADGDVEE